MLLFGLLAGEKRGIFAAVLLLLTGLALAAWIYLLLFRAFFWKTDLESPPAAIDPAQWPAVAAVIPARDEASVIAKTLTSLIRQDYPGRFTIILIDDDSQDETAIVARRIADQARDRVHIVSGARLIPGWTGKLWAMNQGVRHAAALSPIAGYIWFTDADIEHDPRVLRDLVSEAEIEGLSLNSRMALLHCVGFWERLLIPAFVFFFRKLYPLRMVNDRRSRIAAAAGGSVLVRTDTLEHAGGLETIRGELIDDCALAHKVKAHGPIRLNLTSRSRSIRPYSFFSIWLMVARSAYTQLDCSMLLLLATIFGMTLVYAVPWVGLTAGIMMHDSVSAAIAIGAWMLMGIAYWPTIRLYGGSRLAALFLPVAAFLFTLMTLDSARRHWLGKGGMWKGRIPR